MLHYGEGDDHIVIFCGVVYTKTTGRGGRVAEGARLESVFTGNCDVGSNPTLSANLHRQFSAEGIYLSFVDATA